MSANPFALGLFGEDFDAPRAPPPAPEPPPPPEPLYDAAALEAARAAGHAAGWRASERDLAAARVRLLERLAAGLDALRPDCAAVAEAAADSVARTMLAALFACLPALCAAHGAGEVRALARALLPALQHEPRIAVQVHPAVAADLADDIAALGAGLADRVSLTLDDLMTPGDARLSWQDGAASRDTGQIRAAVHDALAAFGLLEREMMDV